jgi:hypothetical protein
VLDCLPGQRTYPVPLSSSCPAHQLADTTSLPALNTTTPLRVRLCPLAYRSHGHSRRLADSIVVRWAGLGDVHNQLHGPWHLTSRVREPGHCSYPLSLLQVPFFMSHTYDRASKHRLTSRHLTLRAKTSQNAQSTSSFGVTTRW